MKLSRTQRFILLTLVVGLFVSCRGKNDENNSTTDLTSELAQQVGDAMAGIDESAGSSGSFAMNEFNSSYQTLIAHADKPSFLKQISLIDKAYAVSCYGFGFGSCSAGTITRNFSGCTIGSSTVSGSTTLSYSRATCRLDSASDTVTRNPSYTMTTESGFSLSVSKLLTGGDGQKLTLTSGTGVSKVFSMTNDGIRRVISYNGKTLFDMTTTITSAITVTGSGRTRALSGGTLRLQNNLTTEQCDISPSATTPVTWSSGCTCAASGIWTGSCQNSGAYTLEITGCGTATLTVGSTSKNVTLSRCSGS